MYSSNLTVTRTGVIRLLLKDKHYKSRRAIGWLSDNGDTFHTKRNPEQHFFYKLRAYGINYDLLNEGRFTWIVIELPLGKRLVTSRRLFLAKGILLNFQQNKLERQLFLPVSEFGIDKAREFEDEYQQKKSDDDQTELFAEVA